MLSLTKKQKEIFDFINEYTQENGISPTIEEIRKKFKLNAISTVHSHLGALIEKKYITKTSNHSRGLEIIGGKKIIEIPIVGKIAAGQPIEAIETRDETKGQ
jgi:repressor LexA